MPPYETSKRPIHLLPLYDCPASPPSISTALRIPSAPIRLNLFASVSWFLSSLEVMGHSTDILTKPPEPFTVALSHDDRAHEHLDRSDIPKRDLSLDHYVSSYLFKRRGGDKLTLPVVWYRPKKCRSSSSLTALGASILLPKMRKGTILRDSIDTGGQPSSPPWV